MRKITLTICAILALLISVVSGCKKDKQKANLLLTSIIYPDGVSTNDFTYDDSGKLIRLYAQGSAYDFFYQGDKLIMRTYSTMGTLNTIDSFFYNTTGQLVRITEFSPALVPVKMLLFTLNGDGGINTISENDLTVADKDKIAEYDYLEGKKTEIRILEKVPGGSYSLSSKTELLAYDNVANPLSELQKKCIPDYYNAYVFFVAGPTNATSVKRTEYDLVTGNPNNVYGASLAYSYNEDGYPIKADVVEGVDAGAFTFTYIEK